ncbi:unnamed protein product [Ceutorhynchus assimilis]|uniref:peptidyl-tRNA hydrolase n=1 Tax=Ceutorhynchus assimilis TaxID=467358 RepID=A0A9N9MY67_9CUCU|nr:unnamed protein product [Ceutorhynchus assimilis]
MSQPEGDFKPNQELLDVLISMGIAGNAAAEALFCTGNKSAEDAINYIFNEGNFDEQNSGEVAVDNDEWEDTAQDTPYYKMTFIVNCSLKMGTGKIAAQVGHACLGLYRKMMRAKLGDDLNQWEESGEKKIVLKGISAEHLTELYEKAREAKVPAYLVRDAGHTQIAAGSVTVLSLFGLEENVDNISGKLSAIAAMEKFYYKLLVFSLHYFAAFAQCNRTSEVTLVVSSNGCPQDNYYCGHNRYQELQFFTCFNINILGIYQTIRNKCSSSDPCYIILKNSSIPTLNPTGYYWNGVKKLQIQETNTNEIVPGFFNRFDNLEELDIIKNKLTKLASGEFTSMVLLRVLNLTENLIETVAPKSFSGLLNLAILDLSRNRITHLPEYIFEYQKHLFYVDVSNNMLKNIDGAVFNKQSLKTLNISYNYLSDFDFSQLGNLTGLEYLRFDHNVLSSLPINAFYNLNKLTLLDLSFNQIKQIPFGLFNDLSELTDLDLSNNNMILDFHTLSTLKSLKVLKFSNNTVENFDVDTLSNRFKYLKSITLLNDQSWNCNELATVIHKLQFNNVSVIRDQSTNGSNILGISCTNSSLFPYYDPRDKVNENVTTISTLFLKLMQNFAINTSNSLTNIEAYMKKIVYNDNTKSVDTSLKGNVPWQNISVPLKEISNNIKQIFRINPIDVSFNQTLINSLNDISNNMKQVSNSNLVSVDKNIESKALISEKHHEESKSYNYGLVFNNILLAMILCCLILFAYRNFVKARIINNNAQEQVQLM